MKLTFLGAAGTVTGSKYLLEDGGQKVLIDCGLFQGRKDLRLRNWAALPVAPSSIHAVILTHAHLDHSGYIPLLVKQGFKGRVYCSAATFDLCRLLLPDSGHIQEEDAENANRHGFSKHHPALPLYTEDDARRCLSHFTPTPFGEKRDLGGGLSFTLYRAGHILGAAFIRLENKRGQSVVFSGDLGRPHDKVISPPEPPPQADVIVVESTYGDRLHGSSDAEEDIGRIVRKTAARGGTVLIPAFAVGRAQMIMYHLHSLKKQGKIPQDLPVYLDSPMASDVSDMLCRYPNEHRLSHVLCAQVCGSVRYTRTPDESKALDTDTATPKIIISASGMATGGRILHHLKRYMGDARNSILLAGYQAQGTRGDRLVRGETEIKIHGQMWPVKAEISLLHNMSAHADYAEILAWLKQSPTPPQRIFVTHGEPAAAESLRQKIAEDLGWQATVPADMQEESI